MTYQAESLAGIIRSNRLFWVTSGNVTTWPAFSVNAAGTASQTGMDSTGGGCVGVSVNCSAAQLAYDDLMNSTYGWARNFTAAFPGATASIACVSASGGTCAANPSSPNGYDITLTWNQKMVAINKSTANSQTQAVSMVMHVQP
jgi:hypothetical protein